MTEPWFRENRQIKDDVHRAFVEAVRDRATQWAKLGVEPQDTQTWVYGESELGRWIMLTIDFVRGNQIMRTLRLDFDAHGMRGGWSPASLNWDEGVPAKEAGVNLDPPDGIEVGGSVRSVSQLSQEAVAWFERHIRAFAGEG